MERKKVVIVQGVRTPWGKPGGTLERLNASDLSVPLLRALLERTKIEEEAVDQVIFGQAHPSTYPNNLGHYAWLKAGLSVNVPGYTVQCNTASALQALRSAYYLIASGNGDICITGGADSYSAAPFAMRDVRNHFYPQDRQVIDTLEEAEQCTQPQRMTRKQQYEAAYGNVISQEAECFQKASCQRAVKYVTHCAERIIPMTFPVRKKGEVTVVHDEWILNPENASPLAPYADGAAAMLLMSEEQANRFGILPKAEVLGFAVTGCNPAHPQNTGAVAIEKLIRSYGINLSDLACLEIIENSAQDVIYTMHALGDIPTVNPFGGALAFGKNDGAEGLFMVIRLMDALASGEKGVACIYSPGGLGMAVLLEKMN